MTSGIANKNDAGAPEGGRRGNHMLNVAERKPKATLLKAVGTEYVTQSPDKRAAEWLEAEVAESKNGVRTQVIDLTPALARVLLSRNDGNRALKDGLVLSYARDISSGAWDFNGEPIIISKDGLMNDGQHRCEAVVAADTPIKTIMVLGVERNTRTTLDQGKVRTSGDYLAMSGHSNPNELAGAASFYWQFTTFGMLAKGSAQRPTKTEITRTVEANPDLVKSIQYCSRKGAKAVGGKTLLAFLHFAFTKAAGRQNADEFIAALTEGIGLSAKSPILYVRNRLINESSRIRGNLKAELIVKAWNAYRRGEALRHIIVTGGMLPKLEK
jgi:hypothetical protein